MRIAVIDLGTNTFNLVIADHNTSYYTIVHQDKFPVKLGEGGINQNIIQPIPFWRGIDHIEKILSILKSFSVNKIYAYATSAIRDAANGGQFVSTIYKLFQLKINVITGNKEAELIYLGVKSALSIGKKNVLIMDIGGGSTEFIIANDDEIFWKKSYKLGAARLLGKFEAPEPITTQSLQAIESYLTKELKTLTTAIQKFKVHELIGSSGSFDTFAEMIGHQFYSPDLLEGKTSFEYRINDLLNIHQQLLDSTREQRLKMNGLIAMRVDMIVIASIFTQYIIQQYDIKKVRLSTYSLKEGVLYKMIQK
jgi:exopolyphosphatase / guanosine-5'-triphosphate,3'-diphosphate pyrophosphatase